MGAQIGGGAFAPLTPGMNKTPLIAGYQGPASILSQSLEVFAKTCMPEAKLIPDVAAEGLAAQSLFDGLQSGEFSIGYMASGYLTGQVPDLGVLDVPFSVLDREEAYRRLDGAAGRHLTERVSATTDLVVLAYWDNGFRHITNSQRPLTSPQDCAGLTVRTLNNQMYQDVMAALGFTPMVTDVKDLVSACETGRVHAQENPLTNMLTFGLDRWHRHVSLTGHIFGVVLLVAHRPWFESLSVEVQAQIRAGAEASTRLQRRLACEADEKGLAELRARGVSILTPDEIDMAGFCAAAQDVRDQALSALPEEIVKMYIQ